MLALERLVIGRECNSFDTFAPERTVLAYQNLIRLKLVVGTITQVPGRAYPDVVIQNVTRAGNKAYQNHERGTSQSSLARRPVLIGIILVIIVTFIIIVTLKG